MISLIYYLINNKKDCVQFQFKKDCYYKNCIDVNLIPFLAIKHENLSKIGVNNIHSQTLLVDKELDTFIAIINFIFSSYYELLLNL